MAAKNEVLGHTKCPLCGFDHQEVRAASNGKPYMICDECGMQMFARQARSVRLLRERAGGGVQGVAQAAKVSAKEAQAAPPNATQPERTIFDMFSFGKESKASEESAAI